MIIFSLEAENKIRIEGEKHYPYECCGFLVGTIDSDDNRIVKDIIAAENKRDENAKHNRFVIEAQDLMKAEIEADKNNEAVLGFYHSHPDHPARPSDYDRDHALPFYSYIIVSVEKGKAKDLTSWRLEKNREFQEEKIEKSL
ncbi:MAG: M67 family metallopeptidase [Elusimicrobiota bacterium]|jgi:proteasome lid subunit RPN8/RPN11|nr:M67 family metallopeptidase [Elusimicrobiota bacterium]